MSVPRASISSAIRAGAARSVTAAGMAVDRADEARLSLAEAQRREAQVVDARGSRGRGAGRSAPRVPRACRRWGGTPNVFALPRHDVRVGDDEARPDDEPGPVLDLVARPSLDPHDRGADPGVDGRREHGLRWRPDIGGPVVGAEHLEETAPPPPSDPARATTAAVPVPPARSSTRSANPARRGRASPARSSAREGSARARITTPNRADRGAGDAVAALDHVHARQSRVQQRADGQTRAPGRAGRARGRTRGRRRGDPAATRSASAVMRSGMRRIAITSAPASPAQDRARATNPRR